MLLGEHIMFLTEIIPTFIYLALYDFNSNTHEYTALMWYNNHFYTVLLAIPSSFLMSVLSDGCIYGKFVSCAIMLTLMFLTALCTLLETIDSLDPAIMWIVEQVTPYSTYVFYLTLPIRVTIFTDYFVKNKGQQHTRTAFAAYCACNLSGVAILVWVYQQYFERENGNILFVHTILLLSLNLVYFVVTIVILMVLPLELPLKNLFLYHLSCAWYALKHQSSRFKRGKHDSWLDPALEKYTQTEVRRTRSLILMFLLMFPIICFACCHSYVTYFWYEYGQVVQWFGPMIHNYYCFYAHLMFTIIFICVVEVFALLPTVYHVFGHFNRVWLLVIGYFITCIPLATIVATEATCYLNNMTRCSEPSIRLINGYGNRIILLSDWIKHGGEKSQASINPGEVLTIWPDESAFGSFGEATVFQYPSVKVTDFFVMSMTKGINKIYYLSPNMQQSLDLKDYDVRQTPEMVLYGTTNLGQGTIIISCSPEFYNLNVDLKCMYRELSNEKEMPIEHLCTTRPVHNGAVVENRPVLNILDWPARVYSCQLAGELVVIQTDIDDHALLYFTSHMVPESESKVVKKFDASYMTGVPEQNGYLILTDLNIMSCRASYVLIVAQLVLHGLSAGIVLVSVYTIHCLHGPPRMRMTSYSLPHLGAYLGLCMERIILSSGMAPLSMSALVFGLWLVGLIVLTAIAILCRFELHSWDIPVRPSLVWELRAWLNRWRHRDMLREKPPEIDTGSPVEAKGILLTEIIKDKTVDDDKPNRKVTIVESNTSK